MPDFRNLFQNINAFDQMQRYGSPFGFWPQGLQQPGMQQFGLPSFGSQPTQQASQGQGFDLAQLLGQFGVQMPQIRQDPFFSNAFMGRHPRLGGAISGALQGAAAVGPGGSTIGENIAAVAGVPQHMRQMQQDFQMQQLLGPMQQAQAIGQLGMLGMQPEHLRAQTALLQAQAGRWEDRGDIERMRIEATKPLFLGLDEQGRPMTQEYDTQERRWVTKVGGERVTTLPRGGAKMGSFEWWAGAKPEERKAYGEYIKATVGPRLEAQVPFLLNAEQRKAFSDQQNVYIAQQRKSYKDPNFWFTLRGQPHPITGKPMISREARTEAERVQKQFEVDVNVYRQGGYANQGISFFDFLQMGGTTGLLGGPQVGPQVGPRRAPGTRSTGLPAGWE